MKKDEHGFLTYQILINTLDRVKDFVSCTTLVDLDIDLKQLHYIVDAKSIMGIFSFDVSKPLTLIIHSTDSEDKNVVEFLDKIQKFIIE